MSEQQPERFIQLKQVVELFEAKPNLMFSEAERALVRFMRFTVAVKCAECGRRSKHHWTQLCSFQARTLAAIVPNKSGKVHSPLTPVCRGHLLAPEYDLVDKHGNKIEDNAS